MVVLLGAELNAEIEHQTAVDSTVHGPKVMGRRGAKMADTVGETAEQTLAKPREEAIEDPRAVRAGARPANAA